MPEFDVEPEPLPTTAVRAPVPAYSGLGTQEDSFGSLSSSLIQCVPSVFTTLFEPHPLFSAFPPSLFCHVT
jgi:hypothetical protein